MTKLRLTSPTTRRTNLSDRLAPGAGIGLFVMLVGVGLVVGAVALDYQDGAGQRGYWNDTLSGLLLIALGLLRTVWLRALAAISGLIIILGVWLVAAPFVFGYGGSAQVADVVAGALTGLLGLAALAVLPARPPQA
jgi:hypothetical protein